MMMMMMKLKIKHKKENKGKQEALRLMKMSWLRSAIWEMDAGLTIILHQRFKLDNTDPQRLSLELTTTPLLMFGVSLVPFLKWSLEISCLSPEKATTMIRTMIIWLR
jgi:hypothetical protein